MIGNGFMSKNDQDFIDISGKIQGRKEIFGTEIRTLAINTQALYNIAIIEDCLQ
jgi:hypothetical protein